MKTLTLTDYVEIQRYLAESITGVTWEEIGLTFGDRLGRVYAEEAAFRLYYVNLAYSPDGYLGFIPPRIAGCTDGLERLSVCAADVRCRKRPDDDRPGWSPEESRAMFNLLTSPFLDRGRP